MIYFSLYFYTLEVSRCSECTVWIKHNLSQKSRQVLHYVSYTSRPLAQRHCLKEEPAQCDKKGAMKTGFTIDVLRHHELKILTQEMKSVLCQWFFL